MPATLKYLGRDAHPIARAAARDVGAFVQDDEGAAAPTDPLQLAAARSVGCA